MSLTLEMRGIAPHTSGLISRRSTIWPTSHVYQFSRNFFSLSQQLRSFSFRSQKIYLLGISICNRLSGESHYHLMSDSSFGDAGHRSHTSCMQSELSSTWATSPWFITVEEAFVSVGKQEVKIFLGRYFLYKTSIFSSFWRKLNNCSMSLTSEMRGIAPRTSGLLRTRSTIWPTFHVYQISRNFFRLVSNYDVFFSFAENLLVRNFDMQ